MDKFARIFACLALLVAAHGVAAQAMPPSPPPPPAFDGAGQRAGRPDWSPEQRQQFREEMRTRREEWRQMSPEERHQLRRDIRDAGRELYPRGRHRGRD
jgi:Spy/CpxP family protein refolding chaperone